MLFRRLAALVGAAATVSAFPTLEGRSTGSNSSVEVINEGGFEVVIVYAQPEEGCSQHRQCDSPNFLAPVVPSPTPSKTKVTTSIAETPAFSQAAPTAKLEPNVHWGFDTSPATNVIPVPADAGSPLYYGHSDPSQSGYFAFLTYYFNFPSVNLDHCDHVSSVVCTEKGCTVAFASDEAYKYALTHWSAYEELILITFTEGCSQYADGERCYLKVTAIEFKGDLLVEVGGSFCHPDDIISKGETEWGWWTPRHGGTSVRTSTTSSGPSVTWSGPGGPTPSASKHSTKGSSTSSSTVRLVPGNTSSRIQAATTSTTTSGAPAATSSASNNGTTGGNGTDSSSFSAARSDCVPPTDSKYGLPTACLGELFDKDLDDGLGYAANLNSTYNDFIDYIAPGLEEYGDITDPEADPDFDDTWDTSARRRRSLASSRRGWPCLSCAIQAVGNFIAHPVDTLVALKTEVQQATSISGSVNKDLTFKVPDPANVEASRLQDPNAKQVTSPWGDSILLKAFGTQPESDGGDSKKREEEKEKALSGYMNVYCVGCGVSGHASVAGRASWTPLGGFIEGQVEMRADVQFVFKLGIDAQMTYSKEFNNNLLRLGLPGLTYGVVTIGPWVEVGSTVKLDAEAKGRLLAGAEMGLQNAHVVIDFINPSKSSKDGWEPYFKPIFEADGELMLSASLGLPFGLKCGLQVGSFSKSVGLIDEPSIKGTAQVAASIGLGSSGGFVAGFKDSNGCTGISTQISWRNKLYVDVLGLTQLSLLDTDDKPLAQGCIALPGLPSASSTQSVVATTSTPTPTGVDGSDSQTSPTPTADGEAQPSPTESPDAEPTAQPGDDEASDPGSATDPDGTADGDSDIPDTQTGDGGSAEDDGSDPVPEDESSDDSTDVTKRHPIVTRATNSTNSTVRDITSQVKSNITTLSYETASLPDHPYNDTVGYEYNLLTVPDGSIIFISCGNGAIYAVSPDGPDNTACTPNWETYNDIIVADGADRIMHYYSNTMEAAGVSRLRVSNQQSVPESGTIVAFVADDSEESSGEDGGYFAALDPDMNVFYPVLCTYSDGNPAKLFLAADPEKGPELLQSADVEYSITGGKVDKCYTMPLLMGQWADDSEGYASYNDSPSDDDDLDYDWDGYDWDEE